MLLELSENHLCIWCFSRWYFCSTRFRWNIALTVWSINLLEKIIFSILRSIPVSSSSVSFSKYVTYFAVGYITASTKKLTICYVSSFWSSTSITSLEHNSECASNLLKNLSKLTRTTDLVEVDRNEVRPAVGWQVVACVCHVHKWCWVVLAGSCYVRKRGEVVH